MPKCDFNKVAKQHLFIKHPFRTPFYQNISRGLDLAIVSLDVVTRIGRFPVQTPLGARPGLGTQPRYEAPGDLRVELDKTQRLTSG